MPQVLRAAGAAVSRALATVFSELTNGPAADVAFLLNPGDPGLFESLNRLSAVAASAIPPGGSSSVAAHVDHLRYGLELLNRWSRGENPFDTADYSASWQRLTVSEEEWSHLRGELRREADDWLAAITQSRAVARDLGPTNSTHVQLSLIVSSVAHLGYHLGAIRQIDRTTRGPQATD